MKLSIASDHAGVKLKNTIIQKLEEAHIKVLDLGPFSSERVDYPDYAKKVASSILDNRADYGVLICGTGIGMSIAANRYPGIRATVVCDKNYALYARAHNNANILCLGARFMEKEIALECVNTFITTPFAGGRHIQRVKKLK